MTINSQIKEVLTSINIKIPDGITYLLTIYYDIKPTYIPNIVVSKIEQSGIYEIEDDKSIRWIVPLFEEQITGFEWVDEWRNLFKKINPQRAGIKKAVLYRMKKFFATHPDIRVHEVIEATKMYLNTVEESKYLKTSNKFILEGTGKSRVSYLKEWVEKYRQQEDRNKNKISLTQKMQ